MLEYLRLVFLDLPRLLTPFPFRKNEVYTTSDFKADLFAGSTVAMILVPQAMALAIIAGLPAIYGLYAALPGFIASLWGSSRHLSTGPVAIVSFLTLTALIPLADAGTNEFIMLAAALAVLVGVIQFLMGALKLGFLMNLIPHSAIVGFTSAASLIIIVSQLPTLLGVDTGKHEFLYQNILAIFISLQYVMLPTLILGVGALIFLIFSKKLPAAFPGTLIVLALGIFASRFFDFSALGIALVEPIASTLPTFTIPVVDVRDFLALIPKAAVIALVGFVEAHAIAKAIAVKTGQRLDTNQELVGQGLANMAVGFFKGYPVSGSFLRTAVNVESGAHSGYAAIITAILTALILVFLAPILSLLPRAVLAAIVIMSAWSLFSFSKMQKMYALFPIDGIIAFITFGLAFFVRPDDALFIGVVLALLLFVRQTVWGVRLQEMAIDADLGILRNVNNIESAEHLPETLIVRPGMPLYYANVTHVMEEIEHLLAVKHREENIHSLVIDFSAVHLIDMTALEELETFVKDFENTGVRVAVIYMRKSVFDSIDKVTEFPPLKIIRNIPELRRWCGEAPHLNPLRG